MRSLCVLQGWCLFRSLESSDDWQHCFVVIENGILSWFNDEMKIKPIGISRLNGSVVITDEYLDQYHHERIISINVDTIYNSNSIIDLGIMEDEVSCWVSLIKLHCNDSMLKDIDLVKLKDFMNNNSDDEYHNIDDNKETVEIQLKDEVLSVDIHMNTNVIEEIDNISKKYQIKDEVLTFLKVEFLKSQVESFRRNEMNMKKHISWMYRRINDIAIYEQRAVIAERHAELVSYSLDSIENMISDIKDDNVDDDSSAIPTETNKFYLQQIKDLRLERVLLIKKINAMKDDTRRLTYQVRTDRGSLPSESFNIDHITELHKLRFEVINLEDKYASMKRRYEDVVEQLQISTMNLKTCEDKLAKAMTHIKSEQDTPHAKLIESLTQENSLLKSHILAMRGELVRLQSESEKIQTSAIDTVSALKDSGLIPEDIVVDIEEVKSKDEEDHGYDIDLFDNTPSNIKKSTINESIPNIIASFKVTPIIENRLFSDIYEKYISDSSGLLTLQRMHRYVKEFNIVGNQPGFLVLGEIDVIFKNVLKIIPDGEEVVIAKARPYGVRAGMNESVYKKDMPQLAVKTPQMVNLKASYESKIAGAQSITRGQFIVANQHIACQIYAGLVEKQLGAALDCLPPKQQKIAIRAVMDTFLKKKLIPSVHSLNMIPWALVHLDRTLSLLGISNKVSDILTNKAQLLHSWYSHYSLFENQSDLEKMSYKSLSKFAHNFAIVPYLLKEPQLHNIFKEMSSWYQADPNIISKLPSEILEMSMIKNKSNIHTNSRNHTDTICFRCFVCVLNCIAIQSFPDNPEDKRIEKLFDWLSQSGGSYLLSKEKVAMKTGRKE